MIRKLKGLWKLLFGRTTLLALLILIQIMILVGGFAVLEEQFFILNQTGGIIVLVILFYILNNKQNTSFKLTWIILILTVPIFGVSFYLYTRVQPGTRYVANLVDNAIERQRPYLHQDAAVLDELEGISKKNAGLAKYIHGSGNYPLYKDTQVKYFPLGEDKFEELVFQLEQAEEFIFMEYFIVDKGLMWDRILDILERKAKEGIEVRFMYDGTCSLTTLPAYYANRLNRKGINCKVFAPVRPFLSTHQNNRDHRKIVVIDGHTAFTGGVNLADEYINEIERFGHWKDTAIMVKGPAARSFTLMFLQNWDAAAKKATDPKPYLKYDFTKVHGLASDGFVIPYGDSPYDNENVGERVYMDILYNAKKYVHIMTPYLILDEEMVDALIYAVKRGVEVIIMMPHIPDKEYAYILARTYYRQLIENGVKIYEYTPGFIHAKVFTSDDEKAVVGTINLDFRSLYLHFEDAVFLYRHSEIENIEKDFRETLGKCHIITLEDCKKYSFIKRIIGALLRLIAPLM